AHRPARRGTQGQELRHGRPDPPAAGTTRHHPGGSPRRHRLAGGVAPLKCGAPRCFGCCSSFSKQTQKEDKTSTAALRAALIQSLLFPCGGLILIATAGPSKTLLE